MQIFLTLLRKLLFNAVVVAAIRKLAIKAARELTAHTQTPYDDVAAEIAIKLLKGEKNIEPELERLYEVIKTDITKNGAPQ